MALSISDINRLEQENKELKAQKDKYYQQTLDDEIQINELYQEIERLKAECDMYKTFYRAKHSDIKGLLFKYKQTLQEIKEIANARCNECKYGKDGITCKYGDCGEAKLHLISQKITKAEEE